MLWVLVVAGLVPGLLSLGSGAIRVVGPPLPVPAYTGKVVRLTLAPAGNEARYRVREQLVNLDFPSDAVGVTSAITGALVLDTDGNVVADESRFVIDVTTLKSDRERRDGYLQRRTLSKEATMLTVPASGTFAFEMDADLTIRAVTRGVRWQVQAEAIPGGFTGTASTRFPFEAFELMKPRVSVVLSVENEIRLEYDFHLVPDTTPGP